MWPFFISLILNEFRSRSFHLLATYTILSFILNIVVAYISVKFDFYFPLCRFWQTAIGGLLAFQAFNIKKKIYVHVLSVAGLITIIISSLFLSEHSFYPGWFALFPTLASASIIMAGNDSIINKYILSNKVLTFIGKISYSLYLWHWPLLVFSKIIYPHGSESHLSKTWVIVLLSVAISIFSYFFIENPLRIRK